MWAYKTTEDFEPLTTTAALSSVTDAIGLVVTGSATLVPPIWSPKSYYSTGIGETRAPSRRTTRGSIRHESSATG